jgi:hypothetical protein
LKNQTGRPPGPRRRPITISAIVDEAHRGHVAVVIDELERRVTENSYRVFATRSIECRSMAGIAEARCTTPTQANTANTCLIWVHFPG